MHMALRSKTRGKYAPQPAAPPAPEKPKKPEKPALTTAEIIAARPDHEGIALNASLAQYGVRVAPLDDWDAEAGFQVSEGVIPRKWARDSSTVMGVVRQIAARRESYEKNDAARTERIERARAEKAEMKSKMYRGMVRLDSILAEMGAGAPSLGRARKAIEAAHMIHKKFHFGPKDVEGARKVLRALAPVGRRPSASAAGPSVRQPAALDGFVRLLVKENPHKVGTEQYARMAKLMSFDGRSVADYLSADGCKLKLKHALARGWTSLDGTAPATPATEKSATSGEVRRSAARTPVTASKTKKPVARRKK